MNDKQRLTELTRTILDEDSSYPELLRDAVIALTDLFAKCSGFVMSKEVGEAHEGTRTATGLALSPNYAVRSMIDHNRTVQFIRGLHRAIEAALEKFERPVHVLYAGTGPYAPLALPLTTVFDPWQVKFTLLDIHHQSLDAVRNVVRTLDLASYVQAYVQDDAAGYRHLTGDPIHIIITETMQTGLEKEMQVAITQNLAPQLCDGGFFIPEKISVHFTLAAEPDPVPGDNLTLTRHNFIDLGAVYELSIEDGLVSDWSPDTKLPVVIPGATIFVPPQLWAQSKGSILCTHIVIFQSLVLGCYDSSITIPRPLPKMGTIQPGDRVLFFYEISDKPGLRYKVLNRDAETRGFLSNSATEDLRTSVV